MQTKITPSAGKEAVELLPNPTEESQDVIELTISEVDRQTAGQYLDINNCLLCTALRNRGLNVIMVGPFRASLEEYEDWSFDEVMDPDALHRDSCAETAPFYRSEVVGKTLTLRRVK